MTWIWTRRWRICLIVWFIVLCHSGARSTAAQGIATFQHAYTFGQLASFNIALPADTSILTVTLVLDVREAGGAASYRYPITLDAGKGVYQRDLHAEPLLPYSDIRYQWEIAGSTTETTVLRYEDNRFVWQTYAHHEHDIHWVTGDNAVLSNAGTVIDTALQEIAYALHTPAAKEVDIYIYPSQADLQSALRLAGYSWVEGVTYPDLDVILLAIPSSDEGATQLKRDIPHELTHKALYDMLGDHGYAAQPAWLVEGLATSFEQSPESAFAVQLIEASQSGTLLPLASLCHPFSGEPEQARLSYAQSQDFVNYLQRNYGWSGIRALVAAYADGMGCEEGFAEALGVELTQLERDWRQALEQVENSAAAVSPGAGPVQPSTRDLLREAAPWLIVAICLLLPLTWATLRARSSR